MDARELVSSLVRELWPGGHRVVTCDEVFARVREMNRQRFEIGSILDAAGVEEDVEHPRRVARLSAERARCLMMCADAQNKTGDLIGQLEAARGDLKVERERSEMLEKKRDEAREWCSLMASERDTLAARVKELEGRLEGARQYVNGLEAWGIKPLPRRAIPADVDMLDMLCNHAKAYIVFEKRDGSGTKVLLKDNNGLGWNGTKERSIDFPPPSTAVNPSKPGLQPMTCPCGGKIEFGSERVGYCQKCGASCRVMDPPPDTCDHDQSLTAALVEANRNTAKWRTRAQKCQQALRHIRALTGDMSFALDEDWGADDDS